MAADGLYFEAGRIVELVRGGKGRVKSLCYDSKQRNKKALFALVTETCKNYNLLSQVLERARFHEYEKSFERGLARVLLHELVGGRELQCSARLRDPIMRNKTRLWAEHTKLLVQMPGLKAVPRPRPLRYARINTLLMETEEAIAVLQKLGYNLSTETKHQENDNDAKAFTRDAHIDDVLAFCPGTDLTKTTLYRQGKLILQDKASCIPAAVLQPPRGAVVLDSCAAPGNKTTHLAALVGREGSVLAFERDPKRCETLRKTLQKHGCQHAIAKCADFLRVDPQQHPEVEYALVDPSCSGSGMLEEYENTDKQGATEDEEDAVAGMKKVVYSTCSVHQEENEEVVRQVLEAEPAFRLVKDPLACWPRRGLPEYAFGTSHPISAD